VKEVSVARVKYVDIVDLVPSKPKERQPSARQIAAHKRESEYEKAINKLEPGRVAVFEPMEEKLPTLRASLVRVIARNERSSELHLAVKGGRALVGLEPIPGARGPRNQGRSSAR
jgi:hypothetical protein